MKFVMADVVDDESRPTFMALSIGAFGLAAGMVGFAAGHLAFEFGYSSLQSFTFVAAGGIAEHRFILWFCKIEISVIHYSCFIN